ncbi:MAG: glycosyltransferase family 1 protein [Bacteroidota bacterium]
MPEYLHIVSFDVPYPPNYGGVIDVYFKIQALFACGVKPILHCFQNRGRRASDRLTQYCDRVHFYNRSSSLLSSFSPSPYSVRTRRSKILLQRLLQDNHPILFEGLQSCDLIGHPKLKHRLKAVRMHHVEWEYYKGRAAIETNPQKVASYLLESKKLKSFEKQVLQHADRIFALSPNDTEYFIHQRKNTSYIPPFHDNEQVNGTAGRGDFVLFHGKLSVKDNERVAFYLIDNVFSELNVPLVIAGLHPSNELRAAAGKYNNIRVRGNLSDGRMAELIETAHINCLLSYHDSGMKLKLLNALFKGRFCLVNEDMVKGNGLAELCVLGRNKLDYQNAVIDMMNREYPQSEVERRKAILETRFMNLDNAKRLLADLS